MDNNRKRKYVLAVAVAAAGMTGQVMAQQAASPSEQAMEAIKTEANNLIGDAWPILVAITVAIIGMKLFKKFASRST